MSPFQFTRRKRNQNETSIFNRVKFKQSKQILPISLLGFLFTRDRTSHASVTSSSSSPASEAAAAAAAPLQQLNNNNTEDVKTLHFENVSCINEIKEENKEREAPTFQEITFCKKQPDPDVLEELDIETSYYDRVIAQVTPGYELDKLLLEADLETPVKTCQVDNICVAEKTTADQLLGEHIAQLEKSNCDESFISEKYGGIAKRDTSSIEDIFNERRRRHYMRLPVDLNADRPTRLEVKERMAMKERCDGEIRTSTVTGYEPEDDENNIPGFAEEFSPDYNPCLISRRRRQQISPYCPKDHATHFRMPGMTLKQRIKDGELHESITYDKWNVKEADRIAGCCPEAVDKSKCKNAPTLGSQIKYNCELTSLSSSAAFGADEFDDVVVDDFESKNQRNLQISNMAAKIFKKEDFDRNNNKKTTSDLHLNRIIETDATNLLKDGYNCKKRIERKILNTTTCLGGEKNKKEKSKTKLQLLYENMQEKNLNLKKTCCYSPESNFVDISCDKKKKDEKEPATISSITFAKMNSQLAANNSVDDDDTIIKLTRNNNEKKENNDDSKLLLTEIEKKLRSINSEIKNMEDNLHKNDKNDNVNNSSNIELWSFYDDESNKDDGGSCKSISNYENVGENNDDDFEDSDTLCCSSIMKDENNKKVQIKRNHDYNSLCSNSSNMMLLTNNNNNNPPPKSILLIDEKKNNVEIKKKKKSLMINEELVVNDDDDYSPTYSLSSDISSDDHAFLENKVMEFARTHAKKAAKHRHEKKAAAVKSSLSKEGRKNFYGNLKKVDNGKKKIKSDKQAKKKNSVETIQLKMNVFQNNEHFILIDDSELEEKNFVKRFKNKKDNKKEVEHKKNIRESINTSIRSIKLSSSLVDANDEDDEKVNSSELIKNYKDYGSKKSFQVIESSVDSILSKPHTVNTSINKDHNTPSIITITNSRNKSCSGVGGSNETEGNWIDEKSNQEVVVVESKTKTITYDDDDYSLMKKDKENIENINMIKKNDDDDDDVHGDFSIIPSSIIESFSSKAKDILYPIDDFKNLVRKSSKQLEEIISKILYYPESGSGSGGGGGGNDDDDDIIISTIINKTIIDSKSLNEKHQHQESKETQCDDDDLLEKKETENKMTQQPGQFDVVLFTSYSTNSYDTLAFVSSLSGDNTKTTRKSLLEKDEKKEMSICESFQPIQTVDVTAVDVRYKIPSCDGGGFKFINITAIDDNDDDDVDVVVMRDVATSTIGLKLVNMNDKSTMTVLVDTKSEKTIEKKTIERISSIDRINSEKKIGDKDQSLNKKQLQAIPPTFDFHNVIANYDDDDDVDEVKNKKESSPSSSSSSTSKTLVMEKPDTTNNYYSIGKHINKQNPKYKILDETTLLNQLKDIYQSTKTEFNIEIKNQLTTIKNNFLKEHNDNDDDDDLLRLELENRQSQIIWKLNEKIEEIETQITKQEMQINRYHKLSKERCRLLNERLSRIEREIDLKKQREICGAANNLNPMAGDSGGCFFMSVEEYDDDDDEINI